MLRHALLAAAVLSLSCSRALPSAEPLGVGPLAEPEISSQSSPNRAAAQSSRPQASAKPPLPQAGADAGSDAAVADSAAPEQTEADAGAGAKDAGAAEARAPSLAGEYMGEDVSVYHLEGMPDQTERDPKARTRVEQPATDRLVLTILDSSSGTPLCSMGAVLTGVEAAVTSGQSCFETGEQRGRVESGTALFSGPKLILDLEVQLFDADQVIGSLDYHFEGARP